MVVMRRIVDQVLFLVADAEGAVVALANDGELVCEDATTDCRVAWTMDQSQPRSHTMAAR
jgi:hypothetical protein